eukprot:3723036-Rhodomonas_salina.2
MHGYVLPPFSLIASTFPAFARAQSCGNQSSETMERIPEEDALTQACGPPEWGGIWYPPTIPPTLQTQYWSYATSYETPVIMAALTHVRMMLPVRSRRGTRPRRAWMT